MKLIDLLVKELPNRGGWPERAKYAWQDWDKEVRPESRGFGFYANELADNHRRRGEDNPEPGDENCVTRAQYESALAKNDGWIEWGGGECPVETGVLVDVKYGCGDIEYGLKANMPDNTRFKTAAAPWWRKDGHGGDIIAYRLHRDINSRANDDRLEQDLNECIGQDVDMPEWSGEGLPPVGVKCEVRVGRDNYEDCLVLYSGEHGCAFTYLGDNGDKHSIDCVSKHAAHDYFRPLRTEAERLREKSIKEIDAALRECPHQEALAEHIYEYIAAGKFTRVKLGEK